MKAATSSKKASTKAVALNVPAASTEATIYLYTGADYTKESSGPLHNDVPKLKKGIDNEVSSCIIESGIWQLFHHPNYKGAYVRLGPGHYPTPKSMGIANNSVSSIRRIPTMVTNLNHI